MELVAIEVWKRKTPDTALEKMLKKRTIKTVRYKNKARYLFTHNWYPHAYSFYNDGIRLIWIYPEDYCMDP